MIVEVADFRVDPKDHEAFGQALTHGVQSVLSKAQGYQAHSILAGIESPGRYLLTVHWNTLEDHTQGFRESPAFSKQLFGGVKTRMHCAFWIQSPTGGR